MMAEDVTRIYTWLKDEGVTVWIDGGWCVDALLGMQTRDHSDLDIAVNRNDNDTLRTLLISGGFTKEEKRPDSSEWMYVLENENGVKVDVHAFEYDNSGNNIYGVEYPFGSLAGTGTIDGLKMNCVAPDWMYKFKTSYEPTEKDIKDVQALSKKFGYELPEQYATSPQAQP